MDSKYEPAHYDTDDSGSTLVGDDEKTAFLNTHFLKEEKRKRGMLWLTLFNLFIFMMSLMTLVCAVFSQKVTSIHSAAKLMDQFGIFSPAMHVVEYHREVFKLSNPISSSKYVGTSNATEEAWDAIAYLPDQMIGDKDFPRLRKPFDSARVTNPKTGETGYRVGLEVFHQLHCLNILRKATYGNHSSRSSESEMNDTAEKVRENLDHCIEILRMNLMCMADVNVFTFKHNPQTAPDYESHHVCRNFDQIRQWALDNAVPQDQAVY